MTIDDAVSDLPLRLKKKIVDKGGNEQALYTIANEARAYSLSNLQGYQRGDHKRLVLAISELENNKK